MMAMKHIQQRGVALATAMVFLIILSIISIGAMRNTTVEQNMSNNMRDLNRAFLLSESGIARQIREPGTYDINNTRANPVEVPYDMDNDGEKDDVIVEHYFRSATSGGSTIEAVYSLGTVSHYIFHIRSEAQYNNASVALVRGVTIAGPEFE